LRASGIWIAQPELIHARGDAFLARPSLAFKANLERCPSNAAAGRGRDPAHAQVPLSRPTDHIKRRDVGSRLGTAPSERPRAGNPGIDIVHPIIGVIPTFEPIRRLRSARSPRQWHPDPCGRDDSNRRFLSGIHRATGVAGDQHQSRDYAMSCIARGIARRGRPCLANPIRPLPRWA